MMESLLKGSELQAAYDETADDRLNAKFSDTFYTMNSNFYELDGVSYEDPRFPEKYDGQLVKVLYMRNYSLLFRPWHKYKMVFMIRPTVDVVDSYMTATGVNPRDNAEPMHKKRANLIDRLRLYPDIDLITVNYYDVLDNPLREFKRIKRAGWPIDPVKCANNVNKAKCRFRNGRIARTQNANIINL